MRRRGGSPDVTDQRWKRVEQALDQVLDLPAAERRARLDAIAADDRALRDEVLALLDEGERGGGPLDGSFEALLESVADSGPAEPVAGLRIGPYRVIRSLGRGGMGEVLLAEREGSDFEHRVAIKTVRAGFDRAEIIERFRRERRILARLRHPNIASFLDGGVTDDGMPYFAMEYVEGERITDYADRERLDLDARICLFESVCAAVAHAHRNLIVHRDLKPGNVLVTADGIPKLLDFGIAGIIDPDAIEPAQTTQRFLTPAYASPEHLRGEPTATATDVYSLGVLLYELLSGRHPHGDTSRSAEVVRAILEDDPRDASAAVTVDTREATAAEIARRRATVPAELRRRLRGDLDSIVGKALRKHPAERYGSVEDLRADLERYRRSEPVAARPAARRYRVGKFVSRNRVAVAAGGVLLAALIGFAIVMGVLYARAEANLARALQAERLAAGEAEAANRVTEFMTELFRVSNPEASSWEQLTARQVLERAVEQIEGDLEAQPLVRARLLGSLGVVHTGLGRFEEARRLHEQGLEIRRRAGGENDLAHADALHNYASLLRRSADYAGALRAYRQGLAIREAALGQDHPDVAASLAGLGVVYLDLGEVDSSLAAQERAITIKRRTLGPDDEAVATSAYNLGALHLMRYDAAAARPYFEESYRIHRAKLGESHLRTLGAMGAIALTMDRTGDLEGALAMQRRVLELQESAVGRDHASLSFTLLGLASMELKAGRVSTARAHAERARVVSEAAHGANHPQVGAALARLAEIEAEAGAPPAARALARRALAVFERAKLENVGTLEQLRLVGDLERKLGNESAARTAFERAIHLAERLYGADHAMTVDLRGRLEPPGPESAP
jgi:serine/threonine-protein kinase